MPEIIIGNKNISERITKIVLEYVQIHKGHDVRIRQSKARNSILKRYTCIDCTRGPDLIFLFKKTKDKPLL